MQKRQKKRIGEKSNLQIERQEAHNKIVSTWFWTGKKSQSKTACVSANLRALKALIQAQEPRPVSFLWTYNKAVLEWTLKKYGDCLATLKQLLTCKPSLTLAAPLYLDCAVELRLPEEMDYMLKRAVLLGVRLDFEHWYLVQMALQLSELKKTSRLLSLYSDQDRFSLFYFALQRVLKVRGSLFFLFKYPFPIWPFFTYFSPPLGF